MKKRVLSLLLVLLMVMSLVPTSAFAANDVVSYGVTGGYLYFDRSTGEIVDCNETVTEAVIPDEIEGVPVTSIGWYAFADCTSLTSVTIPNSVTSIGWYAFAGCTSLTSVTIPNSVTSIDWHAFSSCTSLASIDIPNSVTSIGERAFAYCTSLTSVTIPNSVTSINYGAFENCWSLTSIDIPDSVTSIGDDAFDGCTSLASINVAKGNSIYSSKDGALFNKDKTEIVRYPQGKTDTKYAIPSSVTSIDQYAFSGCTSLTSVTIPNSVTSIGYSAFYGCTSLTSVTIPNSVTSIGSEAFRDCTSLTSVTIPNSVTSIGYSAFSGCTSLTSITIPESVTIIGVDAFHYCTSLTSIDVKAENKVYSSDNGILFNKDKTELIQYPAGKTEASYTIPNSVMSIGKSAFYGCKSLMSVTIPSSVTSIGRYAFSFCMRLADIEIPSSVTSIGGGAFYGCTGLADIEIPSSVTSIGDGAFLDCQSLTDVYYTGTEEQWNAINIAWGNEALLNATIHYNYHEHNAEIVGFKPATCTEDGYTGDEVCTICGETIKEGEVIPATGHHFKGNTCPDCGETRSTADTVRAWFQESFNNIKNFFDKIFGKK